MAVPFKFAFDLLDTPENLEPRIIAGWSRTLLARQTKAQGPSRTWAVYRRGPGARVRRVELRDNDLSAALWTGLPHDEAVAKATTVRDAGLDVAALDALMARQPVPPEPRRVRFGIPNMFGLASTLLLLRLPDGDVDLVWSVRPTIEWRPFADWTMELIQFLEASSA